MPEIILPSKIQQTVKRGFQRMRNYRRARAMFIKEFVGQYYKANKGLSGDQPINLIFHTIRTIVPNLVMQNPKNMISTDFIEQEFYGELLALGLDSVQKTIKFKETLRAWIVAALFAWGIIKVGISASGETLKDGDNNVDPGQVYAELVDLDDFVMDPVCTHVSKATYTGDRVRTPRQLLLDTDGFDHDLVMRMPRSKRTNTKVEDITKGNASTVEMYSLQDFVDVVELWVPEANALVDIPDPDQITFDNYLRITDYYGPKEGPYVYLSFTPPVPNNPYPVSSVSMWYDLHLAANRLLKKSMDQAERQKDVLLYNPANADEAQDVVEARDGDSIATQNPKEFQVASFGGKNEKNSQMLQELQVWFNYISSNPDQMAGNMTKGTKGSKETATRSQILQSNASIGIEDARSILYDRTSEVSERMAWYLHTDPFIKLPVTKRKVGGGKQQLWLTPEQRCGDFLKFTFNIAVRSMSRLDPTIKSKRIIEFATNLFPAMMNSAMIAMQMGLEFNVQKALTDISNRLDISDEVQDWFNDPQFMKKMGLMLSMGPKNAGKAGGGGGGMAGVLQNNGNPMARNVMTPGQENNQAAQGTAAEAQAGWDGLL